MIPISLLEKIGSQSFVTSIGQSNDKIVWQIEQAE